MKIVKILRNKDKILSTNIFPNVIHNRFDLLGLDYDLYQIGDYTIPVEICKNDTHTFAHIGTYLTQMPARVLTRFADFLFETYPEIEYIDIKHSHTPFDDSVTPYPYWHINLPASIEDFNKTLAHRVRYNTKWYPKKIRQDVGDYQIKKYSTPDIPDNAVQTYLDWKRTSHNFCFYGTSHEFLQRFGITDCYVMFINDEIKAVAFVCDTGQNAYFENFSYDISLEKYSLGMVIYYHVIQDMISLKKKVFYLSGGWLDYKRRYNGVLTLTYSGKIKRIPNE